MSDVYTKRWDAFDRRLHNRKENCAAVLKENGARFNFGKTESLISAGPGHGILDVKLIEQVFKNVQQYHAVDPNLEMLINAKKNIGTTFPKLEISTHGSTVEDWKGLSGEVDCVLLAHVLYYIKDMGSFILQCLSWLKKGGILIVIMKKKNAYDEIAEHFQINEEMVNADVVRECLYKTHIKKFTELTYSFEFDISKPDKDFIDFLLCREASDAEVQECVRRLADYAKKPGYEAAFDTIFIIKKTQNLGERD